MAGRKLLVLRIEIADRTHDVVVREHDQPDEVARTFCAQHKLALAVYNSLVQTIDEALEEILNEETYTRQNPSAGLYYRGMKHRARVQEETKARKQLLQTDSELTFRPQLNQRSLRMLKQDGRKTRLAGVRKPRSNHGSLRQSLVRGLRLDSLFQRLAPKNFKLTRRSIPEELQGLLAPCLRLIEKTGELTFNQFCKVMEAQLPMLSSEQQRLLESYEGRPVRSGQFEPNVLFRR